MGENGLFNQARGAEQYNISGAHADSVARCALYRLFAQVFRHPDDDMQQLVAELTTAIAALPNPVPTPSLPTLPLTELRQRYTQLFEASGGRNDISLHESDFVSTTRATVWEDLVRFYEHFGLRYDGQSMRLWPDHLSLELECLHYLVFLESGLTGDPGPLLRAERDFIDRHLLAWLPDLIDRLTGASQAEPYTTFAALLEECLRADRAWLEQAIAEMD